ncbi:MAG TPA: BPSS1780 family membrane protein [Usitatibacter sp.]|nr:BPSS1780 family membrane protein [Usitatibacter sp.]
MDSTVRVADLPALRGARWITESFRLFGAAPFVWMSLCLSWIGLTFALLVIPILGGPVASFLQPAFAASFAIVAYRQTRGEKIGANDIFVGFRHNFRSLVNLGAIFATVMLAIFLAGMAMGLPLGPQSAEPGAFEEYVKQVEDKRWIVLSCFGALVFLKAVLWFAPQLIAFHGMETMQSIRWSAYAAVSNIGALLVYGVLLYGLFYLSLLTFPWVFGFAVTIPVAAISGYVGYRDVFEGALAEVKAP